RIFWRVCFSSA
ncbi:DNA polymerase I domain protein, partial [Chlamydia psittaci 84-8471/1]